jgi:hypothetical protein
MRASSTERGRVVERVVAMLHEGSGAEVRRDVRLPAKNDGARHRQIDVLLLGETAGYQTVVAIECKNFKRPINVRDVGSFKDLLEDVGLSPQQGILVSASRIGSGALSRAREIGMRVFELYRADGRRAIGGGLRGLSGGGLHRPGPDRAVRHQPG